jgi:transcriptional regulator with XRE-family HTH domain
LLSKEEQTKFNKLVGKLIRDARENSKVKQEVLSTYLGFKSRISIANIEAGKQNIQLTTLVEIADYLKVPTSDLIPPLEAIKIQINTKLARNMEKEGIEDPKLSERLNDFIRYTATKK